MGTKLSVFLNTVWSVVNRTERNQSLHDTRGGPKKQVAPLDIVEAVTLSVSSKPW
jgi:hypothetical protein